MTKFFKIKKINFWGVIFAQTEFFLKTLCLTVEVPQHVNVKDAEYTGCRTKNYSITINMQKLFNQSAQFIESFVRYT